MTLFDKYGGRAFWSDTVDIFYGRLLEDPTMANYFRNYDVAKVQAMNTYVLESTLGFTNEHFAVGVKKVHTNVIVHRPDFHRYLEILLEVLREKGMEDEDLGEVHELLRNYESDVVKHE